MAATPTITIIAEPIVNLGWVTITNSMVMGMVGTLVFAGILLHARTAIAGKRYTRVAVAVLWLFEWLMGMAEEVLGSRAAAKQVAPLAVTMFFFIIINNWLEVLPLVGPVSWHGQPLLRGLAADMNFTFSLALITFVGTHIWAIKRRGLIGSIRRYIANPVTEPVEAFQIGLEVVSEVSRTIALSMRLFGNIFGGEVLLLVIGFVSSWAAPLTLPVFMLFELFIGAVQAYIFFMLSITFISLAAPPRESHHADSPGLPVGAAVVN